MTTTDEVKRLLDKEYAQLTLQERAKLVNLGSWRIADTYAHGEDIAEQERLQSQFIDKYVRTLPIHEYENFLIELSELDISELGKRYFTAYINELIREDALIGICLIHIDMRWINEILLAKKRGKGKDSVQTASRDHLIKHINFLRERKRQIAKEVDAILNDNLWDIRGIERPPRPDINPEQPETKYEASEITKGA